MLMPKNILQSNGILSKFRINPEKIIAPSPIPSLIKILSKKSSDSLAKNDAVVPNPNVAKKKNAMLKNSIFCPLPGKTERYINILPLELSMKIIITIPAYNEEKTIGRLVNEIRKVMQKTSYDYGVFVLDDGSKIGRASCRERVYVLV